LGGCFWSLETRTMTSSISLRPLQCPGLERKVQARRVEGDDGRIDSVHCSAKMRL
jgi:hypothetical protein